MRTFYEAEKQMGHGRVTFLQGTAGVYQTGGLTRDDQAIPDELV